MRNILNYSSEDLFIGNGNYPSFTYYLNITLENTGLTESAYYLEYTTYTYGEGQPMVHEGNTMEIIPGVSYVKESGDVYYNRALDLPSINFQYTGASYEEHTLAEYGLTEQLIFDYMEIARRQHPYIGDLNMRINGNVPTRLQIFPPFGVRTIPLGSGNSAGPYIDQLSHLVLSGSCYEVSLDKNRVVITYSCD